MKICLLQVSILTFFSGIAEAQQATPASQTATGCWVKMADKTAFSPRDTAEDVVYDGKMWLSNGWRHGNVLSRDLWMSTDGVAWTLVSNSTPYDPYSEMVVYDGKMWAIKGSVWCSTDGASWQRVAAHTPFGARGYGEALVHQGKIWQLGSGEDVWNTTDGASWTSVTKHAAYGKRAASAVAAFDGKLWLLGGRTPGANTPVEKGYKDMTTHNDVWCSADGATWRRVLEHAPWRPRQWCVAKVYDDRLWLIGGHDNVNSANFGDVWTTRDGKVWHQLISKTAFSPRHEVTCYVYKGSLWVVAGNSWPVQNDVWRLTLPGASTDSSR